MPNELKDHKSKQTSWLQTWANILSVGVAPVIIFLGGHALEISERLATLETTIEYNLIQEPQFNLLEKRVSNLEFITGRNYGNFETQYNPIDSNSNINLLDDSIRTLHDNGEYVDRNSNGSDYCNFNVNRYLIWYEPNTAFINPSKVY